MKLKKLLLRYFPPGIILEYERSNGESEIKSLDLLNLSPDTDVQALVEEILGEEPLIPLSKKHYLVSMIQRLKQKMSQNQIQSFELVNQIKAHEQPLTNCAFDKYGKRFITGSHDRTCKIFNSESGKEMLSLNGHSNSVYCLAFNNPYSTRIATGSFDKTARLWDSETGDCLKIFKGHDEEIVCLDFETQGNFLATGSMDCSAKLWDLETGKTTLDLVGHQEEVISLSFSSEGDRLITGSFDKTAKIWDLRTGIFKNKTNIRGMCANNGRS
jgi:dynein assembly factor with WDR repeat domains 1